MEYINYLERERERVGGVDEEEEKGKLNDKRNDDLCWDFWELGYLK